MRTFVIISWTPSEKREGTGWKKNENKRKNKNLKYWTVKETTQNGQSEKDVCFFCDLFTSLFVYLCTDGINLLKKWSCKVIKVTSIMWPSVDY